MTIPAFAMDILLTSFAVWLNLQILKPHAFKKAMLAVLGMLLFICVLQALNVPIGLPEVRSAFKRG